MILIQRPDAVKRTLKTLEIAGNGRNDSPYQAYAIDLLFAWPFGPQIMIPITLVDLIEATTTVGKKSYIYPKSKKGNHISLVAPGNFLANQLRRKKMRLHHTIILWYLYIA